MCGIAGLVSAGAPVAEADLRPALDAQRHRGPDAWGAWSDGIAALGHRRLSIIDLSEAGRQPMSNEDGTVWITFNGEVYNFQELRTELEGRGHRFRSGTDTEAIVHAYEEWGTDCVRRLRGMFAFAIWDQRRRRLFVARDRVGKKPVFYTVREGRFLFASELQGLLALPGVPREPDLAAVDAYLSWGYVPAPDTAFQGVRKLPAAHWLTVDLSAEGPVVRSERYWSLAYQPKLALSEAEAAEALREKLDEAVRLRMISDVPLGAFLSGGIDSSIVVGLMARHSSAPVKTFSIGFDEADYDELEHARRVAERWGTEHHEFTCRPDALAILPTLVRHYGEPFADEAALPTFYLARMTREHVTVALNGDGGDESFAGYHRYLANRVAERMRRVPGSKAAAAVLSRVLPDSANAKSLLRKARRFLEVATEPAAQRYGRWQGYFSSAAKARLYSGELRRHLEGGAAMRWMETLYAAGADLDPLDAAMSADLGGYLPYDLLVKVDITTMAHSLEGRSPFLDHELMELAARLPIRQKIGPNRPKYLLKKAFADLMPPENVRRGKMGFGVPVGEWFRGPLKGLLNETLLSGRSLTRGWFQPEELRRLVREHTERTADHQLLLWNLLMLELWHRELVEAPRTVTSG
jgi:asparagine synthase (glutamine-hydrolysing)